MLIMPPSTPITETPPSLPSVKLPALKPGRSLKFAGTPARSPLVPPTNPPKVRLLPGTASADASSHKVPSTPHPETSLSINTKKNVTIQMPHTNGGPSIAPPRPKGRPPKPKDGKAVPKAQSGGMDIRDVKACEMALKKLKGNKHARFYLHPVDPVRDKAIKYDPNISLLCPHELTIFTLAISRSSRTPSIWTLWASNFPKGCTKTVLRSRQISDL